MSLVTPPVRSSIADIPPADFAYVQDLVLKRSGIAIGADKGYLIVTRLAGMVRARGMTGTPQLIGAARKGDSAIADAIVDAMTTNETLFFRDRSPFEHFEAIVLPKLVARRSDRRKLRIWCAACSTGQEPYSLAMLLDELKPKLAGWTFEIVATDLSERVLAQARGGSYSQFEVQRGLPIKRLMKYFDQKDARWVLKKTITQAVRFEVCNLVTDFSRLGQFDVIFCRNVLIYFGLETKRSVLQRLAERLAPDGYMLLGGSETVLGVTDAFVPHKEERSLYVRPGSPEASEGLRPFALRQSA